MGYSTYYWLHDNVIKREHFPRFCLFVRGVHRSPVNSIHKGQWRGALMCSLICAWINIWLNNRKAGETPPCSLWRHCNVKPNNRLTNDCLICVHCVKYLLHLFSERNRLLSYWLKLSTISKGNTEKADIFCTYNYFTTSVLTKSFSVFFPAILGTLALYDISAKHIYY